MGRLGSDCIESENNRQCLTDRDRSENPRPDRLYRFLYNSIFATETSYGIYAVTQIKKKKLHF